MLLYQYIILFYIYITVKNYEDLLLTFDVDVDSNV